MVFLLASLAAVCGALGRLPSWPWALFRYAAMAGFLLLLARAVRREEDLSAPQRVFLNFYPMAMIPMIYESLGPLIPAARGGPRDAWLVAADRALFGADPTVWMERFVRPHLTDALLLAYATYYFFPIVVGGFLWRRDAGLARRYIFSLSLAFYVSYAGYIALPAQGPRVALAGLQTVPLETTAISRSISRTLNELEHTKDDAFPSGHTMITAFCLLTAYRFERRLFWAWLPIGMLLFLSTVYCRFHYVVDVLAGLLLAFVAVPLGDRVYARMGGKPPGNGAGSGFPAASG
jgi:membrane-associated phospholipid phosphatase